MSLSDSVWRNLRALAREAADGRETGGFFFGERVRTYAPVSVGWVTRMVTDRRADECRLDIDALFGEKRDLRASGVNHVDEQGSCAPTRARPAFLGPGFSRTGSTAWTPWSGRTTSA